MGDVLAVEAADGLRLTLDGPFAEAAGGGEGNLVLKAARLLQAYAGTQRGAALRLTKNIPVGAGLGGGSADAAAALRVLNRLWGLGLSMEALQVLAPQLGADVAMCLASQPVIARGIGEVLTPLPWPLPAVYAVLVHPRTPLLTVDVYRARAAMPSMEPIRTVAFLPSTFVALVEELGATRNDLEDAARQVSPDVARVMQALARAVPIPDFVRMSGSGACCYALYATQDAAVRAASAVRTAHPPWWVAVTALGLRG